MTTGADCSTGTKTQRIAVGVQASYLYREMGHTGTAIPRARLES